MSVQYQPVLWNVQKKRYDRVMAGLVALFVLVFVVGNLILHPTISPETLIIRASATTAIMMLHIILMIGPLSRLNKKFNVLLYNRRHLGVTMFLFAAIHGIFSLIQFHGNGKLNPFVSLFESSADYGSLSQFPFQPLGFFALLILFTMAATSHDFWLKNLGPKVWKSLHMLVYFAYGLILMHVMLGVIQLERSPVLTVLLGLGMVAIIGLHIIAGIRQLRFDQPIDSLAKDGFVPVCKVEEIAETRATLAIINGHNIAVYKYEGKVAAVANECKHQQGPLSEGKIIDGCITCPWHGYQYQPEDGCSPPPFTEKVATFQTKVQDGKIWVNPNSFPEGTAVAPSLIN